MENLELGGRGSCVAARGRSSRCVSGWRTSRRVTWDRGSGMRCAPRGSRGPQEGQRWCCGPSPRTEHERSGHRRASRLPSLRPSPLCPAFLRLPARVPVSLPSCSGSGSRLPGRLLRWSRLQTSPRSQELQGGGSSCRKPSPSSRRWRPGPTTFSCPGRRTCGSPLSLRAT